MPANPSTFTIIDVADKVADQSDRHAKESQKKHLLSTLRLNIPQSVEARELARMYSELPETKRRELLDLARSFRLQARLRKEREG